MTRRDALLISGALTLVAMLSSCAPATQLSSSWADPAAANRAYKKVAIVGVTPMTAVRRMYEEDFVKELEARGVSAMPSFSVIGEGNIDKATADAQLREAGCNAIVVTRLVDQETVDTYYPPTYSSTAPSAYYGGGWYGYYSMGVTYQTSPGYTVQNKVFRIETNFYDRENDKLVWSGLTKTTVSSDQAPESEILPLIATIVMDMEKHKILPKRTK